ncbi:MULTISPECIES: transglycosylase domain-containing protein [unclassified Streptomyces]|uniref:transglycosylase domain-containing protein n=1 Tax=unclassified Streptomyces TaxID=2593676 RepID=UPI00073CA696|nr:transglycosylase domain-containing protein [Streptomyces sp. AVP053U2]ODA73461.1 Penicillin-binding protein 1A [Streptomyces sp. AVP053U2]
MSEHRRKPPQPQGGGRAAARRGQSGSSSGRRAAPRGATGSPSDSYGSDSGGEGHTYGSRAEARRATQRGGGRRAGSTGSGPGRGRAAPPGRKRIVDYPRHDKYGWRRWMPSWKLVTGLCIAFCGSMVAAAGIGYALVSVPVVAETATAQNNVYYWSDGKQMVATGGERNRQIVNLEQIPKAMQDAVISQENKTFYEDSGIDPRGIARAVFNMAKGGDTQGGSTITQQYVKNAMLDDQSQTVSRKFKEIFVSIKVGATEDKNDILEGYLNSAYYGRGAYGIQAAARAYFDKDALELNEGECAFLSAVLKGATYYDPAGSTSIDPVGATPEANKKRALTQMQDTLDKMVEYDRLDPATRAKYTKLPKVQNPRSNTALSGQIGYLVDLAKAYIVNNSEETGVTANQLEQGGYSIHTTFDRKKVEELEKAVQKVYKKNIKPEERPEDTHVQFGGASVNPATGAIEAIYGGTDATKHFTNNADSTGAQVGSTFKPYVLAAAMKWGVRDPDGDPVQAQDERTKVSEKSLYSGKNKLKIKEYDGSVWQNEKGEQWEQVNDGDESRGTPPDYKIDLREAMQFSVNSAFVQLGVDVGLDKVKDSAVDSGLLESSLAGTNYPSFSLGTSSPSAIRMAGSYATFAASGEQRDPFSVKKVTSKDGTVYTHKTQTEQAFTALVADNVTDVLKTVVEEGTGTNAQLEGREVAGKTGTTDGNKSAWFVGYTPQLSTAISMFRYPDDETIKNREFLEMYGTGDQDSIHGASFPSEIWADYMEDALKGQKPEPFPTPEPIGEIVNDTPSPTATPSPTETEEEETPSASPTTSEPEPEPSSPSPTETDTCGPFDFNCEEEGDDTGGTGAGGADAGGTDGGVTSSPSASESEEEGDSRGNGNGNGSLFGGPAG